MQEGEGKEDTCQHAAHLSFTVSVCGVPEFHVCVQERAGNRVKTEHKGNISSSFFK